MSGGEYFWGATFERGVPSMPLASWVRELVDDVVPSLLSVGAELQHPDGRMVQVVGGYRWTYGVFSNWWTWREVCVDGSLGEEESGYGW